jgi:hypothetical protein
MCALPGLRRSVHLRLGCVCLFVLCSAKPHSAGMLSAASNQWPADGVWHKQQLQVTSQRAIAGRRRRAACVQPNARTAHSVVPWQRTNMWRKRHAACAQPDACSKPTALFRTSAQQQHPQHARLHGQQPATGASAGANSMQQVLLCSTFAAIYAAASINSSSSSSRHKAHASGGT